MRLRGMMRKEAFQILRDPSSIAIAFVMPVVLLLFGYRVSVGDPSGRSGEPSALVQVQSLGPSSSMG